MPSIDLASHRHQLYNLIIQRRGQLWARRYAAASQNGAEARASRRARPTFCNAARREGRLRARLSAVERVSRREKGAQGTRSARRRRRVQAGVCVDGKTLRRRHTTKGGRRVDGKKALHNPAHRCAAGNRRFCLPYAFGNAGDRCGDVQRVLNARFAGADTAFGHYLRRFETEKRVRRWWHDRLCGHFDGRGGMTSLRARRRFVCPSLLHYQRGTIVFVRPQRHRTVRAEEVR